MPRDGSETKRLPCAVISATLFGGLDSVLVLGRRIVAAGTPHRLDGMATGCSSSSRRLFMATLRRLVLTSGALVLLATRSGSVGADPEVQAIAIASATVILASIIVDAPKRDEPDYLAGELGRFDLVKNVDQATAFGIEYRIGRLIWWELRPFVGAGFTSDQSFYGYGGIRIATYWGERIVITPSFAIGAYSHGQGKNLGNPPVLGRSGLDLEYRFDNDMRVGAAYHHMSNGKALGQTSNPGTEVVGLTFSVPFR